MKRFGPIDPARSPSSSHSFLPPHVDLVARALTEAGAGRIGNYTACSFRSEGTGTFVPGPGAQPVVGRAGEFSEEREIRLEVLISETAGRRGDCRPPRLPSLRRAAVRSLRGAGQPGPDREGRDGSDRPVSLGEFSDRVSEVLAMPLLDARAREAGKSVRGCGASGLGRVVRRSRRSCRGRCLREREISAIIDTRAALDLGMSTIDPGHAATERPGVLQLLSLARTIIPGVIDLTEDAIPWKEN